MSSKPKRRSLLWALAPVLIIIFVSVLVVGIVSRNQAARYFGAISLSPSQSHPMVMKMVRDIERPDFPFEKSYAKMHERLQPALAMKLPVRSREIAIATISKLMDMREMQLHAGLEAIRLEDTDFVPALGHALSDEDPSVREEAVRLLIKLGPRAAPVAPDVIKLLGNSDSWSKTKAALILGKIGPQASNAVPVLVPMLKEENQQVRLKAAVALGRIGPAASKSVPALTTLLNDKDADVREYTATAIAKIEKDVSSAKAVPEN